MATLTMIFIDCDDAEKSTLSHTASRARNNTYKEKKRPNREHWCGTGQIPPEGQVRTSHNFRVP